MAVAALMSGAAKADEPAADPAQSPPGAPLALAVRMANAQATEEGDARIVWRRGEALWLEASALDVLRVRHPAPDANGLIPLQSVPGLSYSIDEAKGVLSLSCAANCYPAQLASAAEGAYAATTSDLGGFLNYDVSITDADGGAGGGFFEAGLFGPAGFGGSTWVSRFQPGRSETIRLETNWNFDRPGWRLRLTLGDAITRGGAWGAPLRFGGIKFGTDFSLDPTFLPFPTPTLSGAASLPSSVDAFVNGALAYSGNVRPGPFAVTDLPVVIGAGDARVVVTDLLGRQQVISAPFYASPALLKPGLVDFSGELGTERRRYGAASDDYGAALASLTVRRGFSGFTAEARGEASAKVQAAGLSLAMALPRIGEAELTAAGSADRDEGAGALAGLGFSRQSARWSAGVSAQIATPAFRRLGLAPGEAPPRLQAAANLAWSAGIWGTFALSFARRRAAEGVSDAFGASYSRDVGPAGAFTVSALATDGAQNHFTIGVSYALRLGDRRTLSANAQRGDYDVRLQQTPASQGGFGYSARIGENAAGLRGEASALHSGTSGDQEVEFGHAGDRSAWRIQARGAVAFLGDAAFAARPVRDSFALVDLGGIPGVSVLRDHASVGRTDSRGRLLVTDLRAYEPNRIGIVVDDLPLDAEIDSDEVVIAPGARSGVRVRMPVRAEGSRSIVLRRADGTAAAGWLARADDGSRFPLGADGRGFITGLIGPTHFHLEGANPECDLIIAPAPLRATAAALTCPG